MTKQKRESRSVVTLISKILFILSTSKAICHQLLLSGETQYQSKPELLPG